ncbi:Hypothetical protein CINCED_3A017141 [Cinara cedri]|uniref:Coiled-coil domain-containing protein 39 n=1 Tax=Cinara cedri TaxID=506608 RepID=A0A5E4NFN4_9HEMI|nr:Hypothetical protein CINCED_3A017141 [Cinara cedri]
MACDIRMIDIMKEIGCVDGFHIPVANEENKSLEKEIKELLQNKARLLVTEESLDDELREYKNIFKNLSIQEAQNQKLIMANRQQYETEQHMLITAQRDNDNLSRENKAATKTLNQLIDDNNKLENELAKTDEHITRMRETIEWGEETLLAWNNDLAKENTDVNILERYHLEDNNMFKELDLRRKYLQRDVLERESIVEKEVSELLRVERELEQTSKLTRQAQHERNHLLEQWENAANFSNSNHKETQHIVEEINKIREAAREVYENMIETKRKYRDFLDANEDLEYEIYETKKFVNELKISNLNQVSETENMQSEVLAAQIALNTLGNSLANERTKRRHMRNEQAKLKTRIHQKQEEISKIKENISKLKSQSMNTEERLNELNRIYENQKTISERLLSEKNKVLNSTFHVQNEIKQLQTKIDLMNNLLEQNRNKQIMLRKEESKTKQLIMEKKEVSYNLSFQLEMVRIKIDEAKGTVDIEEMHRLRDELETLNRELSHVKDEQNQLEKQLKSSESESRRIIKEIERNNVDLESFRNRVEELSIRNEGGEKQIELLKEQNHRYHMDQMMAELKVEQMKKMTDNECEKVYSLAQQREEMTSEINRRKAEVAAIYEQINFEKKTLSDEKSLVKRKLDALVQYIEQRKNRYEILLVTLGGSGDGGDEERDDVKSSFTISEHRIRLAREKLELQDTGDRLDERVQKLETEIRAMENTLHVLNASNDCYKSSLCSVNPQSEEYKDKIRLEETYDNLNSEWLQKKKTLKRVQNEIRDLESQYKKCNEDLDDLINLRDIKENELERALKETNEQIMKLNRANNRIQFDTKQIDKSCKPDKRNALELIKRDIAVRLMRKVNKTVLELLSEMSVRDLGFEPVVKRYLSEKDLELPIVSGLTMMNKAKSSCGSSTGVSLIGSSCNGSVKSFSDENRKSSNYSTVNLEPPLRSHVRKSVAKEL